MRLKWLGPLHQEAEKGSGHYSVGILIFSPIYSVKHPRPSNGTAHILGSSSAPQLILSESLSQKHPKVCLTGALGIHESKYVGKLNHYRYLISYNLKRIIKGKSNNPLVFMEVGS